MRSFRVITIMIRAPGFDEAIFSYSPQRLVSGVRHFQLFHRHRRIPLRLILPGLMQKARSILSTSPAYRATCPSIRHASWQQDRVAVCTILRIRHDDACPGARLHMSQRDSRRGSIPHPSILDLAFPLRLVVLPRGETEGCKIHSKQIKTTVPN